MAERRMFSKRITETDVFLDMPATTQCLYFHLNMEADDEGFVSSPKKIMRALGSSEDDFNILVAKRFVLTFQSGVIVIKHWKLHNAIRKDRIKNTVYLDEKSELFEKENGVYTDFANEPNIRRLSEIESDVSEPELTGCQTATKRPHRLGKVSIGKDSIEETDIVTDNFNQFWNLYDKKVGKKSKLEKKWSNLPLKTQKKILEFVPKYKTANPDKQYRKNPETFLNNEGWEDELIFNKPTQQSEYTYNELLALFDKQGKPSDFWSKYENRDGKWIIK